MSENEDQLNILKLLEDLNNRLSRLEQQSNTQGQPMYTDTKFPTHYLPSSTRALGGSGLTREEAVPVCSVCHSMIEDRCYICHHCNEVLCDKPSCALIYLNRAHCERCLRSFHIDIRKREYLVLSCLVNRFTDINTIGELTRITPEDVERSITRLMNNNFVTQEEKFFSLVHDLTVTDEGMEAFTTYRHIYGTGEDMTIFSKKLKEKKNEGSGFDIGLL